ncbi:hypothetical protein ACWGI8_40510 [Streptomyces sp. NPDC054841]
MPAVRPPERRGPGRVGTGLGQRCSKSPPARHFFSGRELGDRPRRLYGVEIDPDLARTAVTALDRAVCSPHLRR